jgi:hypothetical protein
LPATLGSEGTIQRPKIRRQQPTGLKRKSTAGIAVAILLIERLGSVTYLS